MQCIGRLQGKNFQSLLQQMQNIFALFLFGPKWFFLHFRGCAQKKVFQAPVFEIFLKLHAFCEGLLCTKSLFITQWSAENVFYGNKKEPKGAF